MREAVSAQRALPNRMLWPVALRSGTEGVGEDANQIERLAQHRLQARRDQVKWGGRTNHQPAMGGDGDAPIVKVALTVCTYEDSSSL